MAIELDPSDCSIVVVCSDCLGWSRVTRPEMLAARTVANDHERACHPGETQASDALSELRARIARNAQNTRDTPRLSVPAA